MPTTVPWPRSSGRARCRSAPTEPGAEAAEAADHLVGAEQDAVAAADLAHALEVAGRWYERAARVLHRLHDHHCHRVRAGLLDVLLEVLEQERRELLLGLV